VTVRHSPIIDLVPEDYEDLIPYFEALRQVIQEQGAVVADAAAITASNPPAGGTGATAGAYDGASNRDLMITSLTAAIADVTELRTQFNALLAELRTEGTIKT